MCSPMHYRTWKCLKQYRILKTWSTNFWNKNWMNSLTFFQKTPHTATKFVTISRTLWRVLQIIVLAVKDGKIREFIRCASGPLEYRLVVIWWRIGAGRFRCRRPRWAVLAAHRRQNREIFESFLCTMAILSLNYTRLNRTPRSTTQRSCTAAAASGGLNCHLQATRDSNDGSWYNTEPRTPEYVFWLTPNTCAKGKWKIVTLATQATVFHNTVIGA